MAGQLDALLKNVAKQVVSQLGDSLDTTIVYTRQASASYNTSTGAVTTSDTSYTIKVPVEFVQSTEESGYQENIARIFITPDLIGDSQPLLSDEITLTFSGSTRVAKITDVRTLRGGQEYLFRVDVIF
ncbi:phage tail protein [uncultured Mediterranean phage uvMED]|nr:hypothetical protein [uncultured phage MedDCM-OCT-S01-C104]BAR14450.1 phage tail protein [uncultured Mediterranean phage uvMED]BAR21167.1 phage tail protein [uncultured Mediterranean phage uvMED]BAR21907.1 phage tail protein [uncultured Mediterranean phage uvMED]BAR21968.1 phage tail protein [uncultured Mediterranean phage uvMED]